MLKVFDGLVGIPEDCVEMLNYIKSLLEDSDFNEAKEYFIQIEEINKEYFHKVLPLFDNIFPELHA